MSNAEAKLAKQAASASAADAVPWLRRPWMRIALWSAASALVVATIYLGILALLWSGRVAELHDIATDLEDQRVEVGNAMMVNGVALAQMQDELDHSHIAFLVSANRSVRAEDYALYLSYLGMGMGYCVDASEDVEYYVRTKWGHNPYPIHDYDDAVREACMDIRGYFTEVVDVLEEELPEPEPTEAAS